VCLCVRALKGKRLELSTQSLVHIILYGSGSALAYIDPEIKRSKFTVTWLLVAAVGLHVIRLLGFLVMSLVVIRRIRDSGTAPVVVELRRVDGAPQGTGDRRLLRQGGRPRQARLRCLDQLRGVPQRFQRNYSCPTTGRRRSAGRLLPPSAL